MICKLFESCEFTYKCDGFQSERRLVAIRKEVDLTTETRTLFPLPQYEFFCYVTNLKLSPWKIHKKYLPESLGNNVSSSVAVPDALLEPIDILS